MSCLHAVSDQMLSSLRELLRVPVLGLPGLDGIPIHVSEPERAGARWTLSYFYRSPWMFLAVKNPQTRISMFLCPMAIPAHLDCVSDLKQTGQMLRGRFAWIN